MSAAADSLGGQSERLGFARGKRADILAELGGAAAVAEAFRQIVVQDHVPGGAVADVRDRNGVRNVLAQDRGLGAGLLNGDTGSHRLGGGAGAARRLQESAELEIDVVHGTILDLEGPFLAFLNAAQIPDDVVAGPGGLRLSADAFEAVSHRVDYGAGLVAVGRSEADDADLALADLPFAGGRNDDLVGAAASESSRGVGADRSGSGLVSESVAVGNRVAGEKTYHGRQRGQTQKFCTNVHHGLTHLLDCY